VVVVEGVRQIWFESNSDEVDGVATEAVCNRGRSGSRATVMRSQ